MIWQFEGSIWLKSKISMQPYKTWVTMQTSTGLGKALKHYREYNDFTLTYSSKYDFIKRAENYQGSISVEASKYSNTREGRLFCKNLITQGLLHPRQETESAKNQICVHCFPLHNIYIYLFINYTTDSFEASSILDNGKFEGNHLSGSITSVTGKES